MSHHVKTSSSVPSPFVSYNLVAVVRTNDRIPRSYRHRCLAPKMATSRSPDGEVYVLSRYIIGKSPVFYSKPSPIPVAIFYEQMV